jgi:RHS repeat-associated protein
MTMPGRSYSANSSKYRYGYNGKEMDNEVKGNGNQLDYGERIYDPRLGRFLSVDPLAGEYPYQSTYVFAANNPISLIDILGLGAGDPPTSTSKEALTTIGEQKGKLKQSTFFKNVTPESLLASLECEVSDPDNNFCQGEGTNFCSKAAAVSQVWAKNDPKGYANFILDLYNNGKATYNGKEINTGTNAEDAAGKLDAVGLANSPSAQMAFIALIVKYNSYMGSFKKGDEKSEIVSGTFLKTFNTILTDFLGYEIESKGSSAGNRPYVNEWTKRTSNINDVISDLNSQLNKGAVILMINGPASRGEGNWAIATHFIRLYNIQKLSTPLGRKDIMYERWDYGKKTVHYIDSDAFMRSVQGVTTVLGSK